MKRKIIKKIGIIVTWSIGTILVDAIVLFLLLLIPAVQTFVGKQVAQYLSNELKAKVTIEQISISPSLDLNLKKVYISDQHYNPMIVSDKIAITISQIALFDQKVTLKSILLYHPIVNLKKYASDNVLNIRFLTDYFSSSDSISKKNKWKVNSKLISLNNASFSFHNHHKLPLEKKDKLDFNNLELQKVNGDFSNFSMQNDTIAVSIKNFSILDESGFWIKNLSGDFVINSKLLKIKHLLLKTPQSSVYANARLNYQDFSDFANFQNKVKLNIQFFNSTISTKDISYFLKKIPSFNNKVNVKGEISGTLNDLKLQRFSAQFGEKSTLLITANVKNIINEKELFIDGKLLTFSLFDKDIQNLNLPLSRKIVLPSSMSQLGIIHGSGTFGGTLRNFKTDAKVNTKAGEINLSLGYATQNKKICYSALVQAKEFDVSQILPLAGIKKITLHTQVIGSGFSKKTIDVKISGTVDYLEYKKYAFSNIKIDGNYMNRVFFGHVLIDDPLLFLDFNGTIDYSKKIPNYQFFADVNHAHLVDLGLINRHPSSNFSTHLNATINGDQLMNFVGQVVLFDTRYFENGRWYQLENLDLSSELDNLGYRSILLKSDWINASANGKFEFQDLGSSFSYILKKYLPSYAPDKLGIEDLISINKYKKSTTKKPSTASKVNERRFLSFDIDVKDSDPITALFAPKIKAKGATTISGFLNTITQHIDFEIKTDSLLIGEMGFKQIKVSGSSKDSLLNFIVNCDEFLWSRKDTFMFSNIHFSSLLKNDSLQFSLAWNSNQHFDQKSIMSGRFVFSKSPILSGTITSADVWANDSLWHVDPNNSFELDTALIGIHSLRFYSQNKQLIVDGFASHNPADVMNVKLVNFNLSEADTWSKHRNFDLDGVTTGNVELSQIFDKFSIIVNLKIADLGLNGQKLGNANVVSAWDQHKNGLFVNIDVLYRGNIGEAKPVTIQGYFYPKGGVLDMQADIVNFKLKVLEPYLKNLFYRLDGLASGNAHIVGTINKPQVTGKIKLMRTVLGVNYLNTEYTINQEVELQYNRIVFDSVTATDTRNHTAVLNGWVTHTDYKQFKLDVSIKAIDFMALNTTRAMNEMFYGKAFGTGAIRIYGTAPNLQIDAQMETSENTDISVPISFNTVVDKNSFINFVSVSQKNEVKQPNSFIDMGLKMNFLFNVTPRAKFHIFLDPSTGGSLHGSGNGNIRMNVNTNGDFNMFGTFVIAKGEYEMKLKDIVTRTFDIEQGGTIQWNGNPTDAEIDIRAVFPTTASLASVLNIDSSSSNSYNRKIKVLSVLKLSGKLLNPDVRFGIELPNSDNTTRALVYNMIDTTNDQNMIRQTFSLLVLGQLEPSANQYGNIVSSGVGMSTMELISNQLGNFLSQITKDVNVGVNYKTADQMTDELQIAVSTALFNDRVIIDGNLSKGGQNKSYQNVNNVVGDIIVEVKLTNDGKLRTKVYNIANTDEYTFQNAPYIQGLGFIYRVDFNKLSELFRKKK